MDTKTLLTTIQTDLQAATGLSYVADESIFITPDEDYIPAELTFPAIALKDGPETFDRDPVGFPSERWQMGYNQIHAIAYVALSEGDTPVIGGTAPEYHGILDLCAAIDTALEAAWSAISGVEDFRIVDSPESQIIGGNGGVLLLKKRRTYEYSCVPT